MTKLTGLTPMLHAVDISATIAFYTEVLGFALDSAWPEEEPTWCHLKRDDVSLMFTQAEEAPSLSGVLYVRTEDARALHAAWKDTVEVRWGPEVYHYGMLEFAIRDCNGYTLSFVEPTDEPPTCPES